MHSRRRFVVAILVRNLKGLSPEAVKQLPEYRSQSLIDAIYDSETPLKGLPEQERISWPLDDSKTDDVLAEFLFPSIKQSTITRRIPDLAYIRKELLKNGVSKKLLWTEYMEDCRLNKEEPLMYSQFCYHIQQDEQKRRATMHISRKPAE